MPSKRSADEALAIVRALKDRYLTPEIALGAEQGRERLRLLREGAAPPADLPADLPADAPAAPPPEEPAFTPAEREKARAVLAAIRRRLHSGAGTPLALVRGVKPAPWRPKG